jgi:uncharacterized protein with FMN-binding domain
MLVTRKNAEHPIARFLVSTALIVVSASYGYWQNFTHGSNSETVTGMRPKSAAPKLASPRAQDVPPAVVESAHDPAPSTDAPTIADSGAMNRPVAIPRQAAPAEARPPAMVQAIAPQQPAPAAPAESPPSAKAVIMQAGTHLEDGEFIGQHQDFEWGTVQVKVLIQAGAITDVQFLQFPDHRERSAELSDLARPILIKEAIRDQKSKVDIVSSATYTSMAYQDSLADALMKATR